MLFVSWNFSYGQSWDIGGNSVSGSSTLGTTNNYPIYFMSNGTASMNLNTNGLAIGEDAGISNTDLLYLFNKGEEVKIHLKNQPSNLNNIFGNLIIGLNEFDINAVINQKENANLTLLTRDTERLTILGDGKIGIGTITPTGLFDINGGNLALR